MSRPSSLATVSRLNSATAVWKISKPFEHSQVFRRIGAAEVETHGRLGGTVRLRRAVTKGP